MVVLAIEELVHAGGLAFSGSLVLRPRGDDKLSVVLLGRLPSHTSTCCVSLHWVISSLVKELPKLLVTLSDHNLF